MATPPPLAPRDPALERVQQLARLLDQRFLDPILGLVLPGAGDVLGSVLGMYTLVLAVRRKMSPVIVARMLLNLALDAVVGIVPLLGDLFDLGFRANTRNVALLTERAGTRGRATARDWWIVVGATLVFVAALSLTIYAVMAALRAVV